LGGGGRYGGVVEVDDGDDIDDDEDDDDGIMPDGHISGSSGSGKLHRSASEGGTSSLVFRSPNGTKKGETKEFPAGSGIDIVKTKRKEGGEGMDISLGLEDDGDLYTFFKSIRIKDVVAKEYSKVLVENGYDDVESLGDASEVDLELCGIKPGHAKRMKRAGEMVKAPSGKAVDFSKTTSQVGLPRGKSAGEARERASSTLEKDLRRAEQIKTRGRAQSALGGGEKERKEVRLERSDSQSIAPPSYITNNLPIVASLIAAHPQV